jgi:hypothetical protein
MKKCGEKMTKRTLVVLFISVVIALSFVSGVHAAEFKLTPSDGEADDEFGYSVAIAGEYALVGAHYDIDDGIASGSAYIFKWNGISWTEQAKLTASDAAAYDAFGHSVAIAGDYALVGANGNDDNGSNSGSAYIFKRDGTSWNEQAKLTASDAAADDRFGLSVAIAGDYALIGAFGDDDNSTDSGSAYIFKRDGTSWIEQAKLTASDAAAYDHFGLSVAIAGEYALVGAPYNNDNGYDSGSTYIFKRDGTSWIEQAKLTASDGETDDRFGESVALAGEYALITAYADDDHGTNSGSAYIFKRDGSSWNQQAKLTASDGAAYDWFGSSAAIAGEYALVGAPYGGDDGINSGSAYIFKRDGTSWNEQAELTPSDGAAHDRFGQSVAITGEYVLVGAPTDSSFSDPPDPGSAYIYNLSAFDTSSGTYPSISGIHNGTITPAYNISVSKLYTYPCPGAGGHTEYVRIWNSATGWNVTATWNGYNGDWHNLTFNNSFTLYANETYNYSIRTGSYPQIIHQSPYNATGGVITCTEFVDLNGKRHEGWIPAIKLY